jgi:hypothetical protein
MSRKTHPFAAITVQILGADELFSVGFIKDDSAGSQPLLYISALVLVIRRTCINRV